MSSHEVDNGRSVNIKLADAECRFNTFVHRKKKHFNYFIILTIADGDVVYFQVREYFFPAVGFQVIKSLLLV